MKTDDFDFYLPEELIAQTPLENRSDSRLLILDKKTGQIDHKKFIDIIDYLNQGDVLVLNNTKVMPARLLGVKEKTKANIELLLLHEMEGNTWKCMASPAKRINEGTIISFGEGLLKAQCLKKEDEGVIIFKMIYEGIFLEILDQLGEMPLPPYIHEKLADKNRYQTVYAKEVGSAAAPTAGLHFTPQLLEKLQNKGIQLCYITLHVGLGTFRPIHVDDVSNHKMHSEYYEISKISADILNEALKNNKRIVTIGTTSVRTLEAAYNNGYKKCSGWTDIFIYPGYEFKVVNYLVTNFHLPKSTLIMLISALSTKDIILKAYNEAVKERYRFFSFGDSMFIK